MSSVVSCGGIVVSLVMYLDLYIMYVYLVYDSNRLMDAMCSNLIVALVMNFNIYPSTYQRRTFIALFAYSTTPFYRLWSGEVIQAVP